MKSGIQHLAPVLFVTLVGCAKANSGTADAPVDTKEFLDASIDATCAEFCDHDHDGVYDSGDMCPNTPMGQPVNNVGCADSQLTATLQDFPPFGLTWTPTGNLGRAGGLTWNYVGIERKDLFHIYWIVCDDPATPCGVSLDGPIDTAAEQFQFAAGGSDLAMGKLVFTNATHIALADNTSPPLDGRLTITIVDAADMPIPFATAANLNVTPRSGFYGAEILGTAYKVVALIEVLDTSTSTYKPYLDYYDAAPTPATGASTSVSFGGSFYAK